MHRYSNATPLGQRQRSAIPVSASRATTYGRSMTTGKKDSMASSTKRFGKAPRTSYNGRLSNEGSTLTSTRALNFTPARGGQRVSYGMGRQDSRQVDTRNLKDSAFKHKMIMDIVGFLQAQRYPEPIDEKMLRHPSKRQFMALFQFLYQHIDPHFKCPDKIEVEVPALFKELGYPYTIKKSTMQTLSAEHSYPEVLAALHWLVETLNFSKEETNSGTFLVLGFKDDPNYAHRKLMNEALFNGVALRNNEEAQEGDLDSIVKHLADEFDELEDRREEIEVQNKLEALGKERQAMTDGSQEIQELMQLQQEVETKIYDLERFNDETNKYQEVVSKDIEEQKEARHALEEELAKLEGECKLKAEIISKQKCSPEEIKKIKEEKMELEEKINAVQNENRAKQQVNWDLERKIKNLKATIQSGHGEFKSRAPGLIRSLQPEDSDWCSFIDWDRSPLDPNYLDYHQQNTQKYMSKLVAYCRHCLNEHDQKIVQLDKVADTQGESLSACKQELREVERHIAHVENAIATMEQECESDDMAVQTELDLWRAKVTQANKSANNAHMDKNKLITDMQHKLVAKQKEQAENQEGMRKDIHELILLTMDYKERLQKMKDRVTAAKQRRIDRIVEATGRAQAIIQASAHLLQPTNDPAPTDPVPKDPAPSKSKKNKK